MDPNFIAEALRRLFGTAVSSTELNKDGSNKLLSFESIRYQVCNMMGSRYLCDKQKQKVIDLFLLDGEKNGKEIKAAMYDIKSFMDAWSTKTSNFPVILDMTTMPKTIICRNEDGSLLAGDLSSSLRTSIKPNQLVYLNVVEIWLSWYNVNPLL